jgi:hypothetical protein
MRIHNTASSTQPAITCDHHAIEPQAGSLNIRNDEHEPTRLEERRLERWLILLTNLASFCQNLRDSCINH